jgi:hypothetical protein
MDTDEQSTNQENETREFTQDWLFGAFYQPRTIPHNWDLSEMSSAPQKNGNHRTAAPPAQRQVDAADQAEGAASGANLRICYLNPFPDPRTYLGCWHLI